MTEQLPESATRAGQGRSEERTFRATVAYDGAAFAGWQIQCGQPTVQEAIEQALQRICGHAVRVASSGRTDAGVHALAQVVSFRAACRLDAERLRLALQSNVSYDIAILDLREAPADFHALRNAIGKRYAYWIQDGRISNVFLRRHCWRVPQALDVPAMQEAAGYLRGKHDFRSFETSGSPRVSTVRTIADLQVQRQRASFSPPGALDPLVVEVQADGFLYNMVRNIVGSLVLVGKGRQDATWLKEVLEARDRTRSGPCAPPEGLFLNEVYYE